MIRKRDFKLTSKTNLTSWITFNDAINYIIHNKKEIEKTFNIAAYDYNFNEPMNVIVLECDHTNPDVANIMSYAEKINSIFANTNNEIVIDVRVSKMPVKYKNRVIVEHTYFIKEAL